MDDGFELLDPRDAERFLKSFPADTRRKGEALFRIGRVQDLVPMEPGAHYSAQVQDESDRSSVDLSYDTVDGWDGECSCQKTFECEHVFAAMNALLAEHRTATVRNLSASWGAAMDRLGVLRPPPRPQPPNPRNNELAGLLAAAKGQALNRQESQFVRSVHQAYLRCAQTRQINHWDFQQMGMPLRDASWTELHIWPTFPASEHEFWLYVANAVIERGLSVPEFMLPVTDLSLIAERLARWRRGREIERWKQALGQFDSCASLAAAPQAETDLRLVFEAKAARLEWLRPGQPSFEPLKQTHYRQLQAEQANSIPRFTSQAALLWQFFAEENYFYYGSKPELSYGDRTSARKLGNLLRLPELESRMMTSDGHPLPRPLEPLRWELTPAATEHDDYRLQLVQADGQPLPPLLAVLPGRPTLYLTPKALFSGPEVPEGLLEPGKENRIPAPALECTPGVALLQTLAVELPPRLRERIRSLPFQVVISCALKPAFPGSEVEECHFTTQAEAPDGHQQTWNGTRWQETHPKGARRRPRSDHTITLYDTTCLAQVPPLFEPLKFKSAAYGERTVMRVTRKFPELFANWLKTVPPHITVQLVGELASFASADVAGRVTLEATETEIDWFDLRVVLDIGDATLTPAEVKLLLNAKGGYVRLQGKGWRRLQYDLSEEENERLARLGLSPRELSAEPQRLHALQLADEAAKRFLPAQQVEQIQRRAGELKARVTPDLSTGVTAELRPYQLEGFHFLAYLSTNRFGGILADDMGLGKTLQTLAWLLWLQEQFKAGRSAEGRGSSDAGAPDNQHPPHNGSPAGTVPSAKPSIHQTIHASSPPSLVVCPKSVMDNWHAEAARFTPALRVKVWSASELVGLSPQLADADLHVINYSQLRLLGDSLSPVRWLAVILDEGQYIKNPSSQTAQVARSLRAEHRLILSGTPIENRLLDLWSLVAFAMPGVLGSRAQFARLYDAKGDPFARRRLAARVRPFVLRRTKGQVAKDLPDRIEEDLFCEIEGEQKTLYRAELKRAQQLLLGVKTQKELASQQFHFLTSLLRLRQICCHPKLMAPETKAVSAKSEALLEQLEPLMDEGQKVLVFSQFVEMLDLLKPAIEERNWPVFYLAGHTENRGELVRQFQGAEGAAIFLISLKAGGFGLNLTAASYVVLFDPWWNPAVENQAIDRTHRIGQVNKVIAYRLLIKDSIEEKIRTLQKHKKALAEDVLGEEKFAQSLTLQDLHFLFAD
jgi:hypothetical protein